jgi:hypothetical protein
MFAAPTLIVGVHVTDDSCGADRSPVGSCVRVWIHSFEDGRSINHPEQGEALATAGM